MRYVDVKNGLAGALCGVSYPVEMSELAEADVTMVVFPDNGDPWVERDPFKGREYDEGLISLAEKALAEAEQQHAEATRPLTSEEEMEMWRQSVELSRFQARHTLRHFGYLEQVEAYMAGEEASDLERDAWADAQVFRYNSGTINKLCALLEIGPEKKDEMFRYGEQVEA